MNAVRWLGGLALTMIVGPAFGADRLRIIVSEVEVRSGPTSAYYPTSKLRQGDEVDILGVEEGMLKIAPPQGSFDWVSAADVEVSATVATVFKATELRRGSAIETDKNINVMAPTKLEPGTLLSILPGPPQMAGKAMLIKVRPPNNDVRYIPKEAVSLPPGGLAPSAAASAPKIPGYRNETPPPSFGPMTGPANQANSFVGQNTQAGAPPSFQLPAAQTTPAPAFGAQSPPPVLPASYNPPPDNRGSEILPPAFQGRQTGRNSTSPTIPEYNTSAVSISRSTQMTATLTDDPDWVEGERLEEFYAKNKNLDDIKLAISHYDTVGKKYGQIDPTLALRAMNRAQYLRNAISAGVIQQTAVSRSAKPSNYGDTATTEVHPSFSGRSNTESRQTRGKTAQSEVYPTTGYLPSDAAIAAEKSKLQTGSAPEAGNSSAKLDKPLTGTEPSFKGAQRVYCTGTLKPTGIPPENGKKFYRLEADDPKIGLIYCTNQPGVNLEQHTYKHVQIYGPYYFHSKLNQSYVEVLSVNEVPSVHQ